MMSERAPGAPLPDWEGRSAPDWAQRLGVATIEFHSRIGSTSDRCRRLVRERWPLPALVLADRQARGRGRRGRRWVSDSDRGLWFTLGHGGHARFAGTLPLRVGLAVALALESVAPSVRIQVKWPNDLVAAGRKLGGILCERVPGAVLVGVGLNLNHRTEELPEAGPKVTSLRVESGIGVSRARVLASVGDALGNLFTRPAARIPASELRELDARSPLNGHPLSVSGVVRNSTKGSRTVERLAATAVGLSADGSLEVRDRAGEGWRVIAGTVESWS